MWRLSERELLDQPSTVFATVLRGDMVAVARDNEHLVILTRTSTMPTDMIQWDDYVRDEGYAREVYSRVAVRGERIAATHADEVVYFLPISVLAPDGASQPEIEEWLDNFADDWVVGPTFVSVTYETAADGRRFMKLRL